MQISAYIWNLTFDRNETESENERREGQRDDLRMSIAAGGSGDRANAEAHGF